MRWGLVLSYDDLDIGFREQEMKGASFLVLMIWIKYPSHYSVRL
jgi:hypothetical protein